MYILVIFTGNILFIVFLPPQQNLTPLAVLNNTTCVFSLAFLFSNDLSCFIYICKLETYLCL